MGSRTGAAILAALFLFAGVPGAGAQDVTLTSRDGLIVLRGTMQSHDGAVYRVQTKYGLLTLDASGVRCAGPGCPALTDPAASIAMALPSGMAGMMPLLIAGFAEAQGLVLVRAAFGDPAGSYGLRDGAGGREMARITVQVAPADQALADLAAGRVGMALSLRGLPGLPGSAQVLAMDAGVVVVGKGNPVRAISLGDLASVLSGSITNWAALGGGDAPILLHLLAPDAALQQAVEARLGASANTAAVRHADPDALAAAVARDPWAMGVTSVAAIGAARALDLTGDCGIAARPTPWAIRAGDYPLALPVYLYGGAGKAPLIAEEWADWLTSPQAQAAVRAAGWVDLAPARLGWEAQGERLAHAISAAGPDGLEGLQQMVAGLAGAERLSITFRFEPGKRRLDAPSRAALAPLARALEAGLYDGQEVLLAGFAGGNESAALAEAVKEALLGNAPLMNGSRVRLVAAGYGDAMPLVCPEGGEAVNRRVEVWLRPLAVAIDTPPSGN